MYRLEDCDSPGSLTGVGIIDVEHPQQSILVTCSKWLSLFIGHWGVTLETRVLRTIVVVEGTGGEITKIFFRWEGASKFHG